MFAKSSLLLAVTTAVFVSAQNNVTPPYNGALLLQPGSNASKCLRADNANGAHVEISDCTGGSDQQWTWQNGQITLYSGSKCIDVVDGQNVNGVKLQVWDCNHSGSVNQQFTYAGWGENRIKWANNNMCVDLPNGSMTNGQQVQLWSCQYTSPNRIWDAGYMYNNLPDKSETGQSGTNKCGTTSSQSSMCQTAWMNDADDFCLWAPPNPNGAIGDTEREEVAWCTKSGRGTRVIPDGTLKGVHFVKTPDYVQVTGVGDFTKINVLKGDSGGELDPHGADGNGNPIGGLVFGNSFGANLQYHEWASFISDGEFCFRACTGPNAQALCQHIYDVMGCYWNMPANYDSGTFESCKGDNDLPMGVYGTSTWHQGTSPTPSAHPAAPSSECKTWPTISATNAKRDFSEERMVKRVSAPKVTDPPARR